MDEAQVIEAARRAGQEVLGPRAQDTDQRSGPDPANFRALAEAGIPGMAIPREYGGLDLAGSAQRTITQILASYCGVTAFTHAQHHGPARMVASGPNSSLKARVLPDLAAGRSFGGVSFAHLRRPGPPVLRAVPCDEGYLLNGIAPWVTGWGLIDQLVFGATLPDGRFVYVWSPATDGTFGELFEGQTAVPRGSLEASAPLKLCAMNASATVELTCRDWFIPRSHWLFETDSETMKRNDRAGVLGATVMPIGCAEASVRLLRETADRRGMAAVARSAASFSGELEAARQQVDHWSERGADAGFFENAVRVRAWCIELAVRAAHAAVTASSGAANLLTHPAQRLLREAMFYTIQAQTHDVMDATLQRLEAPQPG